MKKPISLLAGLVAFSASALAGSATWLANPANNDWHTAANWTPGGPPNGESDIATFSASAITNITVSGSVSKTVRLDSMTFDPDAGNYTIVPEADLDFSGSGITNNSGRTQTFLLGGKQGANIGFSHSSQPGPNTVFIMGGDAGGGGGVFLFDTANAGDGVYVINGADHLDWGSAVSFTSSASAGNATLTVKGSALHNCVPGSIPAGPCPQGFIYFHNDSTAANATLIAEGGIGDGDAGGIVFRHTASGGKARIKLFDNGYLDIGHHEPPGITIGSLEGDGGVYLDEPSTESGRILVIGSNNLSTDFSGTFVGLGRPSLGALTKVGTGTLTISSDLAYFGETLIQGGRLQVNGSIFRSQITVEEGGTLGGSGTIGNIRVTSGGTVDPGDGNQPLHATGYYDQSYDTNLRIAVANAETSAPVKLDIGGSADLGGTLEPRFLNGFLPQSGQVFKLFHVAGQLDGSFSEIIFPDLRSGCQFQSAFVDGYYQITALNDGVPATGFLNISTRMQIGTGENVLIAGFIVSPPLGSHPASITTSDTPRGTSKRIILRAIGPSLTGYDGSPLPGRLADPIIELRDSGGALLSYNDNWRQSSQAKEIKASEIPPSDDSEAAIIADLAPGAYTAIMRGAHETSGIGIVEVYDLNPDSSIKLINISTRGFVQTGDEVMIAGFIADNQATHLLVRALGPSLSESGIPDVMADPILELYDSQGQLIEFNDDWPEFHQAAIAQTGIPPGDEKESAILATISPGAYTAIVRGKNGTTGVSLVEVYQLP